MNICVFNLAAAKKKVGFAEVEEIGSYITPDLCINHFDLHICSNVLVQRKVKLSTAVCNR